MEGKHSGVYEFAGHAVEIRTCTRNLHVFSRQYISHKEPELIIELSEEDIVREEEKARQEDRLEGIERESYPLRDLEATGIYRKLADQLVKFGIILMHGSAIAVDGEVYLFTAKSGTGKSTHARLWRERFGQRAVMVNDDKPLLALSQECVTVYGTPWNGKHRLGCNMSAPLKAICILERGEENGIERLNPVEAYPLLLQQCNRSMGAEKMLLTLDLLEKLMALVPIYRLKCNMEPEAAKVAFEGMQ